jgi:hypothetical protein
MNLETLSSFALARMLNDAAQGSALQREIQAELRTREERYKDVATPWLFSAEEKEAMRKRRHR